MAKKVSLTGIKPTGMPHIGNYFGAIKPALELAEEYESRYFIADYHALNAVKDKEELKFMTYGVAASWLACGLDPKKSLIYKQSDISETFELSTILAAFTPKGLMNRAHAYKAKVDENTAKNEDPDASINMGLFTYPILMAADILLFDSDVVPIGKDQQQHLEMTADIAEAVNKNYKKELFKIPAAKIGKSTQYIVGMDGRKMSKSYDNTIEMFLGEKKLRKKIMKIVTNAQSIEEKKDPESCNVFKLYKLFSTEKQQKELADKYRAGGMAYSYAKQELFEVMNEFLKPMREKYDYFMENTNEIEEILKAGSKKARQIAKKKIEFLRKEIGIINIG
jgi:tryptophanyl-tRNA synthetase